MNTKCLRLIVNPAGKMRAILGLILCAGLLSARAQSVGFTTLRQLTSATEGGNVEAELAVGPDQALYGLARNGGPGTYGTFFKINRDGSGFNLLHIFSSSTNVAGPLAGLCLATNGSFYGMGVNGMFRINPDGSGFQQLFLFPHPDDPYFTGFAESKPIQGSDGAIYATVGAVIYPGILFKVDLAGTGFQIVHKFTNSPDGAQPYAGVIQSGDGTLYGTTRAGGTNGFGTVYKVQPDGTGYAVLHSFAGSSDGQDPHAALCLGSDGLLYGTTYEGGTNGHGTIYMLDTNGGNFQVIHTFTGAPQNDGSRSRAAVVQGSDQAFYGTTSEGGTLGYGTIFRFLPGGSGYNVIYTFKLGSDGANPYTKLTPGVGDGGTGLLYGTTRSGNTVFALLVNPPVSITPATVQYGTNPPTIFWPAWAINYQLESTTNLNTGTWVPVTNGIPVSGIRLTNTSPASFFRLVLPQN